MYIAKPPLGATLDRTHKLARGLVYCGLINETSGGFIGDYAGNKSRGALTNMGPANWVGSSDGGALQFEATGNYVDLGAIGPTGNSARTYSFKFNVDAFKDGIDNPIVSHNNGTGSGSDFIVSGEDNALSVAFEGHRIITPKGALSTHRDYVGSIVVPEGATTTGEVLVLIGGVNQTLSDEAGSSQTLNTGSANMWLGGWDSTSSRYEGRISCFMLHDRALSEEEIKIFCCNPYDMFRSSRLTYSPISGFIPWQHYHNITGSVDVLTGGLLN